MLIMAVIAAVYLAIVRHQPNNIGGGILTFYPIVTAWLTARRRDGETSRFDGSAPNLFDARYPYLDEWPKSHALRSESTRRRSRWNDLLHGFRDAAGLRGGTFA
jgi:hypothetical protein